MSLRHLSVLLLLLLSLGLPARAQDQSAETAATTAAAAAVASGNAAPPQTPDFLEHLVDQLLAAFDIRSSGNTLAHYGIALLITLLAYVLRRVVTTVLFGFLKRLAARTSTTLDDKLFPALEAPVKGFIIVLGAVAALKVLKFPPVADQTLGYVYTGAFSLVLFWGFLRAFDTVLDHLQQVANEKQLGLAPFMPWIKKTLITIVFVFGVLMIAQSFGADVKAFLAGLGIGGLAFALAAQDTIANLFGSVVVALDQPFRIGETVKIGTSQGTVEDIGLRSTKIRLADRSLVIIPNRTVANEAIVNLSRFTGRRVEQVIGLTYDSKPAQLESLVTEIRRLLDAEPGVLPAETHVYFRDLNASSLDVWVAYVTKDPDFVAHMVLRQRLNLAIMRAVEAGGLSFAFPTQTVHVATRPEKEG